MALSLDKGEAIERLPAAETLADALEGGISARAFARAKGALAGIVVVTEPMIARTMAQAYREHGLVLEGAAAAALAAADAVDPGEKVVVLSGRNVDPARLAGVLST
jgi:threonine dehydratase